MIDEWITGAISMTLMCLLFRCSRTLCKQDMIRVCVRPESEIVVAALQIQSLIIGHRRA